MTEEEYQKNINITTALMNGNHLEDYELLQAVKLLYGLNKNLEGRF